MALLRRRARNGRRLSSRPEGEIAFEGIILGPREEVSRVRQPLGRRSPRARLAAKATTAAAIALWLLSMAAIAGAAPLTPESPEVREAVARGLEFLSKSTEGRLGGRALIGLAYLKAGQPDDHPKVQEAAEAIRAEVAKEGGFRSDIYSTGLSIIFLCNLDPAKYRKEIEAILDYLASQQKSHGGWGYPHQGTGDTSMTQYGVLALWEADRAGLDTPIDVWVGVCNWLLRTQDPGGAFGYQGNDPGKFERVRQANIRASMVVAGLGSLYVCQNYLRIESDPGAVDPNLPRALRQVVDDNNRSSTRPRTAKVDPKHVVRAQRDGDQWMQDNYRVNPGLYVHYYLYGLERYQTFREAAGHGPGAVPTWYDDGARLLLETQGQQGEWTSESATGRWCDTAFSILFLVRSTRQSLDYIERYGAGTLVGGRGLPGDAAQVEVRQGRVVARPLSGPADELLAMIENADDPNFLSAVEGFRQLTLSADEATLGEQRIRLKRLLGGKRPEARAAALAALARQRNLDDVPLLIGALDDPAPAVVLAARDALRYVSRKPQGMGLADHFTEADRRAAGDKWKAWYLSIRPDATFVD